jgi:hypothetical protein
MFSIQVYTTSQTSRRRDGWLTRLLRRTSQAWPASRRPEGSPPDRFSDSPTAGTESERR